MTTFVMRISGPTLRLTLFRTLYAVMTALALPDAVFAELLQYNVTNTTDVYVESSNFYYKNYTLDENGFPVYFDPLRYVDSIREVKSETDLLKKEIKELTDTLTGQKDLDVNVHGSATAQAFASLERRAAGMEWHLGVQAEVTADAELSLLAPVHHLAYSRASARASFSDRFRLNLDGTFPIIGNPGDPQQIIIKALVDATVSNVLGGDSWGIEAAAKAEIDFRQGTNSQVFRATWSRDTRRESGSRNFNLLGTFNATLGPDPHDWIENFEIGLFGEASIVDGRMTFGALQSAYLVGIEFADGTTPEQHGFTIEFESGVTSPNLLHERYVVPSVPEPATITLLAVGGLGLCVPRLRRSMQRRRDLR